MKFSEQIKLLRTELKLKQGEFGEIIGLSQQEVSDIETGKVSPTKKLLKLLEYRYPDKFPPESAKSPQGHTILTGHIETYEEGREHIGMPGKDSDRGSYGLPDLSGHKVTKVFVPDGTISANKYAEILEENRTIRIELDSYKERCAELEKIISSSKAPDKERRRHWMELLHILKGLPFQIQDRKAKYEPD